MKTITLKYMDGLSIPCNIGNKYTTVIDIIKELHPENDYIYSVYKLGNENRLALDTNVQSLFTENDKEVDELKELFILKENIPDELLNMSTMWGITTYTEFIHTTNMSIINFGVNQCVTPSDLLLLQHCKNLDTLSITCDIYNKVELDVESIQYLTSLHTLSISYCTNFDDIFTMSNLKSLSIKDNDSRFGCFLEYDNLTQLQELSLDIDETFNTEFNVIHSLQKLYFKSKGVPDTDYTALKNLTNLEEMTLEYGVDNCDPFKRRYQDRIEISLLNHLPKLRILSFINMNILTTDELDNIPTLEELSINTCRLSNLLFMKKLINLKSLSLDTIFNRDLDPIDPEDELDINPIQYLYNLETIKLDCVFAYISTALCKLPKLKELYIPDTKYTEEQIAKIPPNMNTYKLQKHLDSL